MRLTFDVDLGPSITVIEMKFGLKYKNRDGDICDIARVKTLDECIHMLDCDEVIFNLGEKEDTMGRVQELPVVRNGKKFVKLLRTLFQDSGLYDEAYNHGRAMEEEKQRGQDS